VAKLFEDIFNKIQKQNKEIKCIGIWGKDGLELERMGYKEFSQDIELMGAMLADVLSRFETVTLSALNHMIRINYTDETLMVFSLTGDYFMVILAERGIIPGKLDFYVKIHRDKLISSF
jgi:predicted regulator of Ras-like GTPase activity (Roadblock/LC7/MglB family)